MTEDNSLHVEGSERSMIALIIAAACLLLLLLFLFRVELGIVVPEVEIEAPTEVPAGAYSAAQGRVA
ncbi:hypothetical protein [Sphingomicrobium arenosum]|uniref:hypothetical protein n=1 Tax=Sphingomicrobium arenosum TaxID=2233861 RepID=UPI002240EE19|nr:hypothetical protein [Sphingomicrobium arenosum]